MSYKNKIEIHENKIRELGDRLCKILVSIKEPYPSFLAFLSMQFTGNRYPAAIASLEWSIEEHSVILPEEASKVWKDIKKNADDAKQLYALEREKDDGFKNPIIHMNALMEADDDIPPEFGKRYDLDEGDVKCLWLISPGFEEQFIRKRIKDAVIHNKAKYGQYRYTKRRYKLTEAQAERLVNDIWENPNRVSKVFYDLLDWDKLLQCRLDKDNQERVRQIQADFNA